MDLADWLAHCDRLQPASMQASLERTTEVRERLNLTFDCPLIVVGGTNGKGSTCAMLEAITLAAGYRVGLYQKPELVHFEERCRVLGQPVQAQALLEHFEAVERARGDVVLNRFEFTTLVIARCLSRSHLDLVILEVGLGGRYDAVNVFEPDGVVLTSIDLDHTEILGPDRESIGREKAYLMRPGRPVVVGDPSPPMSVVAHARAVGADAWWAGQDFGHQGDRQQWSWRGRQRRLSGLAYPALRGVNQLLNASAALAILEALGDRLPVSAQAVRQGLATVNLPGRFQILPGQPAVVLDVAHNPQAVSVMAQNLDQMGFYPRTVAVFGAMRDKALADVMTRVGPWIDSWHFCSLASPRAATAQALAEIWASLPRPAGRPAATVHCHDDPVSAWRAARAEAAPADRILIFGSFYTVGGVLTNGLT